MKILGPIIIFIPVLIALILCEWQVAIAFLIAILIVPFLFILFIDFFQQNPMGYKDVLELGFMFFIIGIPIYFILILPMYYGLKSMSIPIVYSFPFGVSITMLVLYTLMTTKPWDYKAALVVIACSVSHGFFIIWLIGKFKSITF